VDWLTQFLPITVIAAVLLFFVKEVIEAVRRRNANARRKRAFRTLLARECELNHWTYMVLHELLSDIRRDLKAGNRTEYQAREDGSGAKIFKMVKHERNTLSTERPLPPVQTRLMDNVMLEVATIDGSLFTLLEVAFDEVNQMGHVRDSLMSNVTDTKQHLGTFADYGLEVLAGVKAALDALYRECTGAELKDARVR
jgi:hypothetical protein